MVPLRYFVLRSTAVGPWKAALVRCREPSRSALIPERPGGALSGTMTWWAINFFAKIVGQNAYHIVHHAVRHSSTPPTNETRCTFEMEVDQSLGLRTATRPSWTLTLSLFLKVLQIRLINLTLIFWFPSFPWYSSSIVAIDRGLYLNGAIDQLSE